MNIQELRAKAFLKVPCAGDPADRLNIMEGGAMRPATPAEARLLYDSVSDLEHIGRRMQRCGDGSKVTSSSKGGSNV